MIDMMNSVQVQAELTALANQVQPNDPKSAQRLMNLRTAVSGSSNTSAWAASDIHELIDPDLVVERFKRQRTTNAILLFCEGLRNIFIFVPLVVTWGGISAAVTSYSDLIKTDNNAATQPFLYLWQMGFNGRLQNWQTLGNLALIDFGLLSIVVALSLVIFVANDLIKKTRERQGEELRVALLHTLAGAALCLARSNKQPSTAIADFSQSITRFDDMIRQLLAQLRDIGDRQGQQQQLFDNFKRDLVTIMTTVSRAVTELKTSNTDLKDSMEALVQPAQTIAGQVGGLAANAQNAVDRLQQQIVTQQGILHTQDSLSTSLRTALADLTQSVQAMQNMAQNITKFADDQKKLVDTQKDISGNVLFAAKHMESFVKEMENLSTRMSQLVKYMDDVARNLTRLSPTPPSAGAGSPNSPQPYAPSPAGAASPNPQQPYAPSPAGAASPSSARNQTPPPQPYTPAPSSARNPTPPPSPVRVAPPPSSPAPQSPSTPTPARSSSPPPPPPGF